MAGDTYTYEFGDVSYTTPNRLSDEEKAEMVESYKAAGYLDPEKTKKQNLSFADVMANDGLMDNYKEFYKRWHGEEFTGNREELAKDYYERMRHFDANLGSISKLAWNLQGNNYTEQERQTINQMFTTWDNVNEEWDMSQMWDAVWDYTEAAATDPANYAGLVTGGLGWGGAMASKEMAKATIRQLVKRGAVEGAKQGAIQGAAYGAGTSIAQQSARGEVGIGDGVDAVETLKDTAMSATVGTAFGGVTGAAGGGLKGLSNTKKAKRTSKSTESLNLDKDGNVILDEGQNMKEVIGALNYMDVLGNPSITGEARQIAREKFVSNLGGAAQAKMRNLTESGVVTSDAERLTRGYQMLDNLGIKLDDTSTPDSIIDEMYTLWEKGVSNKQWADWNRVTIELEQQAHDQLQRAYKSNSSNMIDAWNTFEKVVTIANRNASESGKALKMQSLRNRVDGMTFGAILKEMATTNRSADEVSAGVTWLAKIAEKQASRSKGKVAMGKAVDALNEFWINNILGSPVTLGINVASSGIHMIERDLTRLGAAALQRDKQAFRLAASEMRMQAWDSWRAFGYALKSLAKSEALTDTGRNFVDDVTPAIGTRNFDFSSVQGALDTVYKQGDGVGGFAANLLGNFNRALGSRAMVASDELVKQMAFRGNLYRTVLRDTLNANPNMSYREASKLAADEYRTLTNKHLEDMALGNKITDKRISQALEEARTVTFQNDFKKDPSGNLGRFLNKTAFKHPMLRQIMPFIRTPANLLSHNLERTPVLNATSAELRKMLQGAPEERAKAQMVLNVSTLFWASAIGVAAQGKLQGGDNITYNRKTTMEGNKEFLAYSYETPDGDRIQIRRGDPYAFYFMTMGSLSDIFRYGTPEQQASTLQILVLTTSQALLGKTTLTGVADLAKAVTDTSKTPKERLDKFSEKRLKTLLPYYRFVRDVFEDSPALYENLGFDVTDPTSYQNLAAAAYFLDNKEDPFDRKRSPLWGTEMQFLPSAEIGFYIPFTDEMVNLKTPGFPKLESYDDKVVNEITRLGMEVPPPPAKIDGINWKDIKVKKNGRRSVYDMYAEAVGRIQMPEFGNKTLHGALKDVIENPLYWRELTDNRQLNLENLPNEIDGSKQMKIMSIVNAYRGEARRYVKHQLGQDHELYKLNAQMMVLKQQQSSHSGDAGAKLLAPLTNQ